MNERHLALFDFDGTITKKDSFRLFLQGARPYGFFITAIFHCLPVVRYTIGRYPNQRLKELFLRSLFQGMAISDFHAICHRFCEEKLPAIIRHGFWERYELYQKRGTRMVVVTATPRVIIEPWCKKHRLDLLGSELEKTRDLKLTGALLGENCMGEEKVRQIRNHYDLDRYGRIYAYGDSPGDLPMLGLAAKKDRFYRPFRI